ALRNLAEAQAAVFLFQCAQNGGRPRNHLHLAFVVGHQTIHYVSHPHNMTAVFRPPCIVGHDSPKSDTAKREKMRQTVGRQRMVKKIALEEHFLDPATEPYWRPTMVDVAPPKTAQLFAALTDFGEQRLKMMEQHGIARAILAIAGPGVQA